MKTIKIGGRELQYQTLWDEALDGSDIIYTEFYEGTEVQKCKKYILFGPVIEKEVHLSTRFEVSFVFPVPNCNRQHIEYLSSESIIAIP